MSTEYCWPLHHTFGQRNRSTLLHRFHDSNQISLNDKSKNKKHLKNVGPIHHCEPPHAHSPDVASGTVASRLRIDVHNADDDNDNA